MTTTIAKPLFTSGTPGIYPGVHPTIYHGFDACSNSRLKPLADRTPAHCKHLIDHPREATKSLRIGDGSHTFILEPHLLDAKYVVSSQCAANVKSTGNRCKNPGIIPHAGDWFCGQHGKDLAPDVEARQVLTQDEFDKCRWMRDAVHAHPAASDLLHLRGGENELSALAHHDGLLTKIRIDRAILDVGIGIDLKSTQDAGLREFEKSIFNFSYHRQLAIYLHTMALLGKPIDDFAIIAFESEAPFGVAVYRLKDDAIRDGWAEAQRLMAIYARCQAENNWPCYSGEVQDIGLPEWAKRRMAANAA